MTGPIFERSITEKVAVSIENVFPIALYFLWNELQNIFPNCSRVQSVLSYRYCSHSL